MANGKWLTYAKLKWERDRIEQAILQGVEALGEKNALRDACEYALKSGGKRFRPLLVLLVADALNNGLDVMDVAVAVEFFHTASLIADDLPQMDNSRERRGKPTVHTVYGESTALLASYSLICAAFEKIHLNTLKMKNAPSPFRNRADSIGILSLGEVARSASLTIEGQFHDLFHPSLNVSVLKEVVYRKTVKLFETCFTLGWLFGGGDIEQLERVKESAHHLGIAFQILDDLRDLNEDQMEKRESNIAHCMGREKASMLFYEEMDFFKKSSISLGLFTEAFQNVHEKMLERSFENVS